VSTHTEAVAAPAHPRTGERQSLAPCGPENDFTNRSTTFMTWNLMHLARMFKDSGGVPAHGNQRSGWDAGARFDWDNPKYR